MSNKYEEQFKRFVDPLDSMCIEVDPRLKQHQLEYVRNILYKAYPNLTLPSIWTNLCASKLDGRGVIIGGKALRLAVGAYGLMNTEPVVTRAVASYIFYDPQDRVGDENIIELLHKNNYQIPGSEMSTKNPEVAKAFLARAISMLSLQYAGREEVLLNESPGSQAGYWTKYEYIVETLPYARRIMAEIINRFILSDLDMQVSWELALRSNLKEMASILK